MAIVSRQDFADMCGDSVKLLNVYISRKKVILHDSDGKLIDTENMINMLYKKKRKEINKSKKEDGVILNSIPPNPRKNKPFDEDDPEENELPPPLDKSFISEAMSVSSRSGSSAGIVGENMQAWIHKKMKGDADLVALRVEKEQLLLDKAAGKLVPVEIAADVLRSQAKTIFANFEKAIENIASIYCQIMANGDMSMYTRIVESGQKELSNAISRAGADADKDLDTILTNYTDNKKL